MISRRVRPPALGDRPGVPATREEWMQWIREDFLRSCFVGGSLAWDGFGVLAVRSILDPYYPGQDFSPAWVYLSMLAFLAGSIVAQILLYRRWWPHREGESRGDFGTSRREAASAYQDGNLWRRLRGI